MSSSLGPNSLQEILTLLALSYAPGRTPPPLVQPPDCAPRRTPPPLVQPSADGILHTLSPTDAHVFRSALANVPLIYHTPPFLTQLLPPPADDPPARVAHRAEIRELGSALEAEHAKLTREQPVAWYALFLRKGGILARVRRIDDIRYAARAALRFTAEELDDEMYRSILGGTPTW